MEQLLTVEDLAERLKISPHTVRAYASRGKLPVVKLGTRTLFSPEAIEGWLAERSRRQVGKPPLSEQILAALVRGWTENPKQTLRLARVLVKLHRELGAEGLTVELIRALVDLPAADRASAFRLVDSAVEALRTRQTLSAAGAKAKV